MDKSKRENRDYYHSLTRNMLLTVIIVSFTPMILVGGIILYQFQRSYHEKVHAHLEELVQKHKQNIDSFLKENWETSGFWQIILSLRNCVTKHA